MDGRGRRTVLDSSCDYQQELKKGHTIILERGETFRQHVDVMSDGTTRVKIEVFRKDGE